MTARHANGACPKTPSEAVRLLASRWPGEGGRNAAYRALVGALLRHQDWPADRVEEFVADLAETTGDSEVSKRLALVARTAERLQADQPCDGFPKLIERLGQGGEATVGRVKRLLGLVIDLEQFAAHKKLPVSFLRDEGLHDLESGGVGVPYRDAGGKVVAVKQRVALRATDGSYWPRGVPPLPYGEEHLSDAGTAGRLLLVEGESDVLTLRFHGYHALGLPGSDTVDRALYPGHVSGFRDLLLVQEPGASGTAFVNNTRRRLTAIDWRGTLRVVRLDGFKDPSAMHIDNPEKFRERWERAVAEAQPVDLDAPAEAAEGPDLLAEPPWPDPPAEEAYHGLAGKIVRTIGPSSEADPAALLVQTLIAFGSAAGRYAHFLVEGDTHFANEFAVIVGTTGKGRKGTSWGRIERLFRGADKPWASECVQGGLSSGEGLIWAVRDPIYKREQVKGKGPARYEEVEADPGVADKRLLALESEFAGVLKQTERQGNTLSPILRLAWDRGDLQSMTKNSPARATGAHFSLIGHITADELRRYLTQTETANGSGNRHLWVCARRSKVLPEGGTVDPAAWEALQGELAEALAFARGVGEVRRDDDARALWCEVYGELSEGRPGLTGALLGRAEAHVMRLALIYALMDRSDVIGAEHLLAALALWEYCERSVRFIFGDRTGDPVADDIMLLLRRSPAGLTRNELRDYFSRNQSSDRIGQALGLLLRHGLARYEQQKTGGRPSERWFAGAPKT
jgi:hypothetical protein